MKKHLLFTLFICLSLIAKSQEYIYLKSGKITTFSTTELNLSLENNYCFLVLKTLPSQIQKEEMKLLGVQFLEYLPQNTYIINLPKNFNLSLIDDFDIIALFNVAPENKLDPKIQNNVFPDWAFKDNNLSVKILFYKNTDISSIKNIFGSLEYSLNSTNDFGKSVSITINSDDLVNFSALNDVWFIEPIDPPSFKENKTARTLIRSNSINTNYSIGRHYNGEGINIMMQDDGLVGPHIDRQGRVDQSFCNGCSSSVGDDHGDHVSGTIMGAGNLDPITKGMADGSFLYVYGSSNNNYYDVPNIYQNNDVIITSKSYSNGCNAGYTSLSKDLDEQINLYPSLIHVFSAGNNGNSDCGYGAGAGWGNVTGGHKQAKNVLCVANLTQISNLAGSSSRGPAADGRIKPDIGAKGTSVNSTLPNNTYDTKTGTSMSCPGVAGATAQLYQAYKELNSGFNPPSALIKCVLLNSADDIGNPGPDFKHGWGELNAFRAVKILEDNHYDSGTVSQSTSNNHDINIPSGTKELKIMVYWHDKEASTSSSIALVNNINIHCESPTGSIINPWVLDPSPNLLSLNADAVRGVDSLNNMEQITISNPISGVYDLTVVGLSIPFGPQEYWVSYELQSEEIAITYPIGGEGLVPGDFEMIRWDAPNDTASFMLEYTVDNGIVWNTITTATAVNANYYNWQVPSSITDQARIRISRNNIFDESDANFTIVNVPNLSVNWYCPDSIYVSWDSIYGATGYEVSMLGQKYMDSMTTVLNSGLGTYTALIINPNPLNTNSWFSVCSKVNGQKGRRAIAVNAQSANNSCTAPPIASYLISDSISCSGTITFQDNSYGLPTNWNWDFGDGNVSSLQNPSHTYLSEGTYDVSLNVSNSLGQDSIILTGIININFTSPPITINDTSYINPSSFTLSSLSSSVNWYLDTLGSPAIFSGTPFITPLLFNNTTYFVREYGGPVNIGGPIDNAIGNGNFYNNDRHLYIDNYKQSKIISTDVYAGNSQNITFELRDDNSQVLEDTTIFVQLGLNTLFLNFDMPIMNNLELGISSTGSNLYRNSSGASFPYLIGNIASITGHNSPYAEDSNYHYFFYNLKIQETCLSNYSSADAIFISPSATSVKDNLDILIYPNPAKDKVVVKSNDNIENINIYDASGRLCFISSNLNKQCEIDVSFFSKGIYAIQIINSKKSIISKLIIE
tara:strand:- start:1887 stop:5462 length:3576 start_codon:yes stop_codon:yes gene_type:complete